MTNACVYPLPIGAVLDGRYVLHATLGHGGMGCVYEGEDLRLGRRVAIKLVHTSSDDQTMGERLFREARAAARADHPAVVTAYAYGTDPDYGLEYFVMERLIGETLGERIARVGPLPVPFVLRLALDTTDALIAIHGAGVIHRDLKPSNVFLASRGRRVDEIKLLDFGLAKQMNLQTLTATGQVYGTPQYMAPEQLSDAKHLDERCDIYALGVMMFECLAGALPFSAQSPIVVAVEAVYGAQHDVRTRRLDVPEKLAEIIGRCMMKDRSRRFSDARSLYAALSELH